MRRRDISKALLVGAAGSVAAASAAQPATSLPTYDIRRYGAKVDRKADDTAALRRAIDAGSQVVRGAQGAAIEVPTGAALLSSMIQLPNRIRVLGRNKRGSYFLASSGHPGPWMFNARNGRSSMFDSTLENVTVDCNNIAGLGCVLSDAWQEDCGLRGVLLLNFATVGVRFQNGFGGSALAKISDTEIIGGKTAGCIGIDVQQLSSVGAFMLDVSDSSISTPGAPLARGINIVNDSLHCRNVHFEKAETAIYLDGVGNHVLIGVTGATDVINLVELASSFTGTLTMLGCFRNGARYLVLDHRLGGLGALDYDVPNLLVQAPGTGRTVSATNAAAAWCSFDGTSSGTHAPLAGFNVSSVTRNATGDYTLRFTRTLRDPNASVSIASNRPAVRSPCSEVVATAVDSCRIRIAEGGALVDADRVMVTVFGTGI